MSRTGLPLGDGTPTLAAAYTRHFRDLDEGRAGAWVAGFTPDATFQSPTYGSEPLTGEAGLRQVVTAHTGAARQAGRVHRHVVLSIDQAAPGQVVLHCLILGVAEGGQSTMLRTVWITDSLTPDGLIAQRLVRPDGPSFITGEAAG